jgi:hypothetical protein
VKAFDGHTGTLLTEFYAFDPRFGGGVRVASGDLNDDGVGDLVVAAGPGGGPHVKAFDLRAGGVLFDRFVADPTHRDGVRAAVARHFDGEPDALVTRTRSGDVVDVTTYTSLTAPPGLPQTVWVGDGDPPADFIRTVTVAPRVVGAITPIRTVEGAVTAVAADGKSMTVRRGETDVTVHLVDESYPPLPPGSVYIDDGPLPPADILLGDDPVGVDQLHVGRWVRATVGRAFDPSAAAFTALRVRLL